MTMPSDATQQPLDDVLKRREQLLGQIELKLFESILQDGFGGGSDLFYDIQQQKYGGGQWIPISVVSDRKDGANWPLFRDEAQLSRYRQQSRIACQKNAYIQGVQWNLGNHIIGKGFTYRVQAKMGRDSSPAPGVQASDQDTQVVNATQAVVDDFLARNRWTATVNPHKDQGLIAASRERESVRRVDRDGDVIIRLFFLEGGRTAARFVEPEQITNPPWAKPGDGWSFGIRHAIEPFEDEETIEAYYVRYKDPTGRTNQGEVVPASQIVHIKPITQDAAVKRGLPTFILDTLDAYERAAKLQRNVSISSSIRAATAEIWKHTSGTEGQIRSLSQSLGERSGTNPTTGREENYERYYPGMVRRIPQGQEPVWPQAVGAAEHTAVAQADLRQAITPMAAPEHFTGDASNANYSSTKEAGNPFVLGAEVVQEHFKVAFTVVVLRAIAWAAECDKLPSNVLDVVELQVETPSIVVRDPLQRAQEDQILNSMKVKSRRTCQMERALDPEHEDANIEEDEERFGNSGGDPLGDMLAGGPDGDGGDSGGGGFGGDPAGNPPGCPISESVESDPVSDDNDSAAEAWADILGGLFGDRAAELVDFIPEGLGTLSESIETSLLEAGFSGTIVDVLGRKITYRDGKRVAGAAKPTGKGKGKVQGKGGKPALKPKTKPGEAAKRAGDRAAEIEQAHAKIKSVLAGDRNMQSGKQLVESLSKLTVKQLHALKATHQLKASAKHRAELVKKIADRLGRARHADLPGDYSDIVENKTLSPSAKIGAIGERAKDLGKRAQALSDSAYDFISNRVNRLTPAKQKEYFDRLQAEVAKVKDWEKAKRVSIVEFLPPQAASEFKAMLGNLESLREAKRKATKAGRQVVAKPISIGKVNATIPGPADWKNKKNRDESMEAVKFIESACIHDVSATFGETTRDRAYATKDGKVALSEMGDIRGTAIPVHELGHQIENQVPGVKKLVVDFLEKRIKGTSPVLVIKGENGEPDEWGFEDDFVKTFGKLGGGYVGKLYLPNGGNGPNMKPGDVHQSRSTEVVSMGVEKLYDDPAYFAKSDPEYFDLIVKVLHGTW